MTHEEGHDRQQAEVEDGGQRQRVVEPRDLGVAEWRAGARGHLELGHRAVGHSASSDRLERDAGGERGRSDPRAREPGDGVQGQGGDRHRHAHDGAVRDPPGEVAPDQDPLVEAPVADRRRPRQQDGRGDVGEPRHLVGEADQALGDGSGTPAAAGARPSPA